MNDLTEEKYRKLQKEVNEAKSEAERAKGALEQLMTQLKEEFDCESLKEAKAKLEELQAEAEKAKRRFEKLLKDYEEKWKTE